MTLIEEVIARKPKLTFTHYYKYCFFFSGKVCLTEGEVTIYASTGGNADNIYGIEVSTERPEVLTKETFSYISVKNINTLEEETWSE